MGPHFQGDQSLYFLALNSGKRSIGVRLASDEGRAVVEDLVRDADVVIDNYRPGVLGEVRARPRRVARGEPGDRHVLAHRVRRDRARRRARRVRLHHPGPGRRDEPGRRARRTADQGRASPTSTTAAASPPRWECAPRSSSGRAPGSARTSTSPLRRADLDAHLPRLVAAQPRRCRSRAPRTPRTRRWCRRRTSAPPTAISRCSSATTACGDGSSTRSATRRWRPIALRHARGTARTPRRGDRGRPARAPHRTESRVGSAASARSASPAARSTTSPARSWSRRRAPAGLVVQNEHPAYGRYEHLRGPLPTLGHRRRCVPAPLLGEHTTDVLERLGYSAGRVARAARAGIVVLRRSAAVAGGAAALVGFLDHPPVVVGDPRGARRTRSRRRRGRGARWGRRPVARP